MEKILGPGTHLRYAKIGLHIFHLRSLFSQNNNNWVICRMDTHIDGPVSPQWLHAQWCACVCVWYPLIAYDQRNPYEQLQTQTSQVSNLRLWNWCPFNFWFDYYFLLLLSFEFVELYFLRRFFIASSNISIIGWNFVWFAVFSANAFRVTFTYQMRFAEMVIKRTRFSAWPMATNNVPNAEAKCNKFLLAKGFTWNARTKTEMEINGNLDFAIMWAVNVCENMQRRNKFGNDLLESCNFARRQQHACIPESKHPVVTQVKCVSRKRQFTLSKRKLHNILIWSVQAHD